ncbi:hypothetical protein CPG37_00505 [Malaciobacter canalis]|uniref:Uncharacterized protein n=1 Tax=Malaciobacter canalis TaxID=1912871 RepID=A0ABX4LST3_9BACT|nr:hypothetical protein [Malaciobacter canalis]PHO10962.1 hypothetical protein CPG37_00505 [Malaciobacter canalis]QEE33037.1 hypothetical protein ACAN_1561 [Malaciobacter canalis]
MEQNIDVYAYFLNISVVALVTLFFVGIYIKLSSIFMAIMAYPTYIALYAFELALQYKKKDLETKKFFRLNIPSENPKKYWMNFIAMLVTTFSMTIAIQIITIVQIPQLQISFFKKIFDGSLIPYPISITILIGLLLIYLISFSTENDNRAAYDKIESLSIPSLWKTIIK